MNFGMPGGSDFVQPGPQKVWFATGKKATVVVLEDGALHAAEGPEKAVGEAAGRIEKGESPKAVLGEAVTVIRLADIVSAHANYADETMKIVYDSGGSTGNVRQVKDTLYFGKNIKDAFTTLRQRLGGRVYYRKPLRNAMLASFWPGVVLLAVLFLTAECYFSVLSEEAGGSLLENHSKVRMRHFLLTLLLMWIKVLASAFGSTGVLIIGGVFSMAAFAWLALALLTPVESVVRRV